MDIHEQRRVDESRIKLLYITPEKFSKSTAIRNLLQQLMQFKLLSRFVLDEAHCLSQWGHDFRPDYLRLTEIRQLCPSVPIMALTATANQSVVQDIIKCLHLQAPFVHTQSFNRPNLTYKVSYRAFLSWFLFKLRHVFCRLCSRKVKSKLWKKLPPTLSHTYNKLASFIACLVVIARLLWKTSLLTSQY